MTTQDITVNQCIIKAQLQIEKAIILLQDDPAYTDKSDPFHNDIVYNTNRLITILMMLED